ncbi:MAG: caspase family protein [Bacteroidetes bacterium]|nr:caspase family protein [Bacteroidota bacterium]
MIQKKEKNLKKEIDGYSASDFSFNGAYFNCTKNDRKIYNLTDLVDDIGKYLNTWSFFYSGKSEKKHFNFAYENKVSYTDKREDFGHVYFWNGNLASKNERSVRLNITQNNKFIFYTPDMYYSGSSNLDNIIFFEQNLKLYPFEQFDLKYNRPDIILKRLGYCDSLTIASYHKAYLKRLKKMNFTEDMLKGDFHLPEIRIESLDKLPATIDSSSIEINLKISDSKYNLDRINVYINNVPVYGSNGIDLRVENSQAISKRLRIDLAEGENKIQVSVLNQAGVESYKETLTIFCKQKVITKPDLYLVTIGDSKYNDNRYNLTYASKDAEDIKSVFTENKSYNKVISFTYTDEKVTKENILALKRELQKAKRNDIVIITVAGHGLLDKNLDYYLATYDVDFENPTAKGIPYEQLESLVDGIAPLKKVIFIDACHSGEIDKEEVEQLASVIATNTEVKFRSAGAGIQKKQLGIKSTGELMGELFTDLRKGTGATVISSAGGAEYAMESAQWKNGLFTYCMLHGLKDKAADTNNDGKIMLSELQNYLRIEVSRLSNGAQQPTSRIENLSMDFRIW